MLSSPTGEPFLADVRVGRDQRSGETEAYASGREPAFLAFCRLMARSS